MTAPPPRRPWYRRKRAWAAAVLWLLVAYPLSRGPAEYAAARGRLPRPAAAAYYGPLDRLLPRDVGPPRRSPRVVSKPTFVRDLNPRAVLYYRYIDWWAALGRRHAPD